MVQCVIYFGPIRVKNTEKKIRHKKNLPQIMLGVVPTFTGLSFWIEWWDSLDVFENFKKKGQSSFGKR